MKAKSVNERLCGEIIDLPYIQMEFFSNFYGYLLPWFRLQF